MAAPGGPIASILAETRGVRASTRPVTLTPGPAGGRRRLRARLCDGLEHRQHRLGRAASSPAAYGVGLAAIGLFTTALFITHAGMQIPAGSAADRFGARRTGILALALIAVFNLARADGPRSRLWPSRRGC